MVSPKDFLTTFSVIFDLQNFFFFFFFRKTKDTSCSVHQNETIVSFFYVRGNGVIISINNLTWARGLTGYTCF